MFVNVVLRSGQHTLYECESVNRSADGVRFDLEPSGIVIEFDKTIEAVYYMNSDGHTIQRHRNKKSPGD